MHCDGRPEKIGVVRMMMMSGGENEKKEVQHESRGGNSEIEMEGVQLEDREVLGGENCDDWALFEVLCLKTCGKEV